jgi:hypothetical protein
VAQAPGRAAVFRTPASAASEFLDGGQRITLWVGGNVGHGTITRRVFTEYGPY